jgi:hypothetical protein
VKGGVVYVDGTFIEVGGVEITAAVESCAREAGVARAVGGFDHDGGASLDGGAPPGATPTVGFHPDIVPSIVEKRKSAGAPGASRKSVGLLLAMVRVGVPVGKTLLLGSDFGMVTTSGLMTPAPL